MQNTQLTDEIQRQTFTSLLSEPKIIGAIISIIPQICVRLSWPALARLFITGVLSQCLGERDPVKRKHADFAKELFPDLDSESAKRKFRRARKLTEECFDKSGFALFVCYRGKRKQTGDQYSSEPSSYVLTEKCADFIVNVLEQFDTYDVANGPDNRTQQARIRTAVLQSLALFDAQPIPRKPHQKRTSPPTANEPAHPQASPSLPEIHTDEPYTYDRRDRLEELREEENEFLDRATKWTYDRVWKCDDVLSVEQINASLARLEKVVKIAREAMRHRVMRANEPPAQRQARIARERALAEATYTGKWQDLVEYNFERANDENEF